MNRETLNRGKEIEKSLECIHRLRSIMLMPYPSMFSKGKRDKNSGFIYDGNEVSFARLDEETRIKLKEEIVNILDEREKMLNDELKSL